MPVPDRNSTVDTLRTAALIGICVVNLPFMGLPQGAVLSAPDGLWNQAAALFTGIFFEAKFFMLFSFLFGWGIEIQQGRPNGPAPVPGGVMAGAWSCWPCSARHTPFSSSPAISSCFMRCSVF